MSNYFEYFEFLNIILIDMATLLMMSAKLATPGLLKIKISQNKGLWCHWQNFVKWFRLYC